MDHSGEYFTIGEYMAIKGHNDTMWRVSHISDMTVNSVKLTVIGTFQDKDEAIKAMRRNGMHLVKTA